MDQFSVSNHAHAALHVQGDTAAPGDQDLHHFQGDLTSKGAAEDSHARLEPEGFLRGEAPRGAVDVDHPLVRVVARVDDAQAGGMGGLPGEDLHPQVLQVAYDREVLRGQAGHRGDLESHAGGDIGPVIEGSAVDHPGARGADDGVLGVLAEEKNVVTVVRILASSAQAGASRRCRYPAH